MARFTSVSRANYSNEVNDHRNDAVDGFTKKYGVHRLVYYELHADMLAAIEREKQLKKWNRAWKLELFEEKNPQWKDLWDEIV